MDSNVALSELQTSAGDVAEARQPGERTWSCDTMSLAWLPSIPSVLHSQRDVMVLVPAAGAVVHVAYASSSGRNGMAYVNGEHVLVAPPDHRLAMRSDGSAEAVALRLDGAYVERVGELRQDGIDVYAGADPFVREAAGVLRAALARDAVDGNRCLSDASEVLAAHLASNYAAQRHAASCHNGLAPHQLRAVEALVRERMAEPLGVRELARSIEMSAYHFSRMFKRATGWSPYFFVTLERVERAKTLLRDTDLALSELAVAVGLTSQGHFTEVFRKLTGETPRNYRQRHRGSHRRGEDRAA